MLGKSLKSVKTWSKCHLVLLEKLQVLCREKQWTQLQDLKSIYHTYEILWSSKGLRLILRSTQSRLRTVIAKDFHVTLKKSG